MRVRGRASALAGSLLRRPAPRGTAALPTDASEWARMRASFPGGCLRSRRGRPCRPDRSIVGADAASQAAAGRDPEGVDRPGRIRHRRLA